MFDRYTPSESHVNQQVCYHDMNVKPHTIYTVVHFKVIMHVSPFCGWCCVCTTFVTTMYRHLSIGYTFIMEVDSQLISYSTT